MLSRHVEQMMTCDVNCNSGAKILPTGGEMQRFPSRHVPCVCASWVREPRPLSSGLVKL